MVSPERFKIPGISSTLAIARILPGEKTTLHEAAVAALPLLFPEIPAENIVLDHRNDGSPFIPAYGGFLSVSHAGDTAVVARNDSRPVGIDIESPRQQLERVRRRFTGAGDFAPERTPSSVFPTSDAPPPGLEWLLRLWTAKEAVYKAAGLPGLALCDIRIESPVFARIPDGRTYRLTVSPVGRKLVTVAELIIPGEQISHGDTL